MTFVYVLRGGNRVKIGSSKSPKKRLIEIQTGCPDKQKIWWHIRCARARSIESMAHKYLRKFRTSGEWFDCCPDLAASTVSHFATGLPDERILEAMFYYEQESKCFAKWPGNDEYFSVMKCLESIFVGRPGVVQLTPQFRL
jgi:hypothetical protein